MVATKDKTTGPKPLGVLTVMVGNTRTTAVRWSPSGRVIERGGWPTASGGHSLARRILATVGENDTAIIVAGVVPSVLNAMDGRLRIALLPPSSLLLRFRKELPCPLAIRPRPARRVGDDRLAAALGARAIDPRMPWVVVDAGTALTVNGLRPGGQGGSGAGKGTFEGGLIVPGEQLALAALGGGTAQLPALKPLDPGWKTPGFGRSTEEAIRCGVRRAQIAAACELSRAQARCLGAGTRIVLTGGGAAALWPSIRRELKCFRPVWVPDLVHRGLRFAFDSTLCC